MTIASHVHETALARVEFAQSSRTGVGPADSRSLRGSSPALARLLRQVETIRATGFSGLIIVGESGTGKRELAQRLHEGSARAERPLLRIDATQNEATPTLRALAEALRDPNHRDAPGSVVVERFEAAGEDLVDALLGLAVGSEGHPHGCALLLLSTRPLDALRKESMATGQLLGRCVSAVLRTPPLRERVEDIDELARDQARRACSAHGLELRRLSEQALGRLARHSYRGNLRELAAIVELAVLRADGDWITEDDLGLPSLNPVDDAPAAAVVIRMPGSSLRDIELQAIRVALQVTSGRLVRAAELLGITRHALRRKLEKYGLTELRARTSPHPAVEGLDEDSYI